jgi:hypothetical protein
MKARNEIWARLPNTPMAAATRWLEAELADGIHTLGFIMVNGLHA